MEKILEGNLPCFEVPDLLAFLHAGGRTGVLVLERAEQESKLFLREGRPVFATSTGEELRFGSMLRRLGKVDPRTLERVLQRHRTGGRIGQLLLSEKILSQEELASFLKVQVSEVIFDVFTWREGCFTFYDEVPPPATAVTLEMDLHNLVMEGVRRIEAGDRLTEVFADRDVVVESLANPERVKQTVTLTEEEWRVFFLVDGRRSVGEICRLAGGRDERPTLQILHHLLLARFVGLAPVGHAPAPGPAPPPPEAGLTRVMGESAPDVPSVSFSAGVLTRKAADDTREIVSKKAVHYLADAKEVTVSRLVLVTEGADTSFPLIRDSYTVGRHRNNDIVVSDPKASSFHARIDRSPEGFVVVDLKSRNGSWVNGKRVTTVLLKTGDELRLGMAKLIYKVEYTSSVS